MSEVVYAVEYKHTTLTWCKHWGECCRNNLLRDANHCKNQWKKKEGFKARVVRITTTRQVISR